MSQEDALNQINHTLEEMAESMKPKPKKNNKVALLGWVVIGIMTMYLLDITYKFFARF